MAARISELGSSSRTDVGLVIDGKTITTREWMEVRDPAAPHSLVGRAASATAAQARSAVDAAHRAWKGWAKLDAERRARAVLDALEALEDDFDERVELLVRENGKVLAEAEVELGVFAWRCELAAGLAPALKEIHEFPAVHDRPEAVLDDKTGEHPRVRRYSAPPFRSLVNALPLGVVTIIVPYNWPLAILAASLPYALVAGNTVIVKPPPTTPLAVVRTLEIVARQLPAGVLNVVTGTNENVAPLIEDPRVRRIVFTGSTSAGRVIMKAAAENMTRVTLELGGNDPAIVMGDARLDDDAIRRLTTACFLTSGQVCMGVKRIYVHRSRYDEVVAGMSKVLEPFVVGHGLAPDTTMGPLNSARQRDFVRTLVEEARASGAEIRELGRMSSEADPAGYFLRPSLVLSPSPELRIVGQEQFGPAVPILPFDDVEPLVDALNEEWAGLCSSVWTSDAARAADLAGRLRTGTVWINAANAVAQDDRVPFGGFRMSGLGRELGIDGLLEMTELHSVTYAA